MRLLVALCVFSAVSQPSMAEQFLRVEPSALDPYAIVFVNDGSCSTGKVLKITGAIRGHRKKACVPINDAQALLVSSSPEHRPGSREKE